MHRIGILDIRLFNTDRHAGNLLVRMSKSSRSTSSAFGWLENQYSLVPIDHGFCLPEALEPPYLEWLHWPQVLPHSDDLNLLLSFSSIFGGMRRIFKGAERDSQHLSDILVLNPSLSQDHLEELESALLDQFTCCPVQAQHLAVLLLTQLDLQAKIPFDDEELQYIAGLDAYSDVQFLRQELPWLPEGSLRTLQVCRLCPLSRTCTWIRKLTLCRQPFRRTLTICVTLQKGSLTCIFFRSQIHCPKKQASMLFCIPGLALGMIKPPRSRWPPCC